MDHGMFGFFGCILIAKNILFQQMLGWLRVCCFFCFCDRVSLCAPGWPGIHHVDQA